MPIESISVKSLFDLLCTNSYRRISERHIINLNDLEQVEDIHVTKDVLITQSMRARKNFRPQATHVVQLLSVALWQNIIVTIPHPLQRHGAVDVALNWSAPSLRLIAFTLVCPIAISLGNTITNIPHGSHGGLLVCLGMYMLEFSSHIHGNCISINVAR